MSLIIRWLSSGILDLKLMKHDGVNVNYTFVICPMTLSWHVAVFPIDFTLAETLQYIQGSYLALLQRRCHIVSRCIVYKKVYY